MLKLSEIAEKTGGRLTGEDINVKNVCSPENPLENCIVFLEKQKYSGLLENSPVKALMVTEELFEKIDPQIRNRFSVILIRDSKESFSKLLNLFSPYIYEKGRIDETAKISTNVKLGKGVSAGAFTEIREGAIIGADTTIASHVTVGKNVRIGKECRIMDGVRILEGAELSDRIIIHPNTVIGGEGFGYYEKDGKHQKIPQIGGIMIEEDVEIGANVTVDRATLGKTIIKKGVKIDNLVQVAHNVEIGENTILVAQVGIAGSSKIGKNVILAGQVGVADHVNIEDRVVALGQTGIIDKRIKEGRVLFGTPSRDAMEEKRIASSLKKLPEMAKMWKKVKEKLNLE